ncbi:RDD family protein [Dactylosporangium sp. NPDC051484]|uniref:RDD family protein n=1 Tax=Dactylosporangium sp. NPDC051484 TaxID=3154942 RepID=UPI0034509A35
MNYANWIQRVGAYLIDAAPAVILSLLGNVIAGPSVASDGMASGPGPLYFVFLLLAFAWLVYNRWILGGQGASLGKKALGLRLFKEQTGQPLGFGGAFLRDLGHIVDSVICYVGWLFPLWDQKRQTIADKIVGSVVTKG